MQLLSCPPQPPRRVSASSRIRHRLLSRKLLPNSYIPLPGLDGAVRSRVKFTLRNPVSLCEHWLFTSGGWDLVRWVRYVGFYLVWPCRVARTRSGDASEERRVIEGISFFARVAPPALGCQGSLLHFRHCSASIGTFPRILGREMSEVACQSCHLTSLPVFSSSSLFLAGKRAGWLAFVASERVVQAVQQYF